MSASEFAFNRRPKSIFTNTSGRVLLNLMFTTQNVVLLLIFCIE